MKIFGKTLLLSFLVLSFSHSASAQNYGPESKRFGAGIILGDPSGLTLKGYLNDRLALSGIASWSFVDEALTLIGDFTYEMVNLTPSSSTVQTPFYLGAGAKVAFDDDAGDDDLRFGARVPVGVAVQWNRAPIEVFLEVAPGFEMIPESEFDITGGLGIRYYF